MAKIQIEYVNPNELQPYKDNPRINEDAVEGVLKSIEEFDWTQPILVNAETKEIAIGHVRWKASVQAKFEEIPVIFKKFKNRSEFEALVIADNKLGEKAKWDVDKVSEMLERIQNDDENLLDVLGYNDDELDALLDSSDIDDMLEEQELPQGAGSSGPKSHVKMVQIFLDDVTFPKFIEMAEGIQQYMTTDNLTDTVYNAVETVYDQIKDKK